jgi:hypothetical protein
MRSIVREFPKLPNGNKVQELHDAFWRSPDAEEQARWDKHAKT